MSCGYFFNVGSEGFMVVVLIVVVVLLVRYWGVLLSNIVGSSGVVCWIC